ncbi:transcriptional regulator [Bordetella ansorpii]|uniref:Transcriptional regulator n=1 Tax=Bordetella ansorpii TaxID=288768 RepID=A0A157NEJ3_9BORD|nr:IclR family transcriptional regulator [Bordetella ansorpii]SAI19454.1 transcriptional regulator [Bordetella ansorpii]
MTQTVQQDAASADDSPLGRAFRVIELLASHPEGLTLSEVARESGLVVTTAHRQLASLIACGVVRKTQSKSFVAGEALWRIASLMTNGADIVQRAAAILTELADRFGETAFLARLNGHDVEIMTTCTPTAVGKAYAQPGRGMPLYAAASGKVLLAQQDEAFIEEYLKLPRNSFTSRTLIDAADIRAEIDRVRQRRLAICENEFDPGILSYAAPVVDPRTGSVYAIAIFGMAERFGAIPGAQVEAQVLYAAQRLATALGTPD